MMYPKLWLGSVCVVASLAASAHAVDAKEPGKPIRAGIIGVDTSHAVAFATLLQRPKGRPRNWPK